MVEVAEQTLKVAILYNPFDLASVERVDVVYTPGNSIADYMGELSGLAEWTVGYKGEAYTREAWSDIVPEPGEGFSVVLQPAGGGDGGGGKDILRMVAMIAVAVVAFYVAGPWAVELLKLTAGTTAATAAAAIATATFAVAGMLVVNAVLPPPGLTPQKTGSPTYGVDGAKNTSEEGIVTPITYGKNRVAGNVVDLYTKNIGDDQYLFMRTVLNDGRINSVSNILLDDQPIENFSNVETRIHLGGEGVPNDWFGEAVRPIPKQTKLTTAWTTYTTTTEVDRLRLDLLYPSGLGFKKSDGRLLTADSSVSFEYKLFGTSTWQPLPSGHEQTFLGMTSGVSSIPGYGSQPTIKDAGGSAILYAAMMSKDTNGDNLLVDGVVYNGDYSLIDVPNPATGDLEGSVAATSPAGAGRLTLRALAELEAVSDEATSAGYHMRVGYRKVGTTEWTFVGDEEGTVERTLGVWTSFPMVYRTYEVSVDPNFQYEVTAFGGTLTNASALLSSGNGTINISRAKRETFRYSYETSVLPRGRYDVRVKRNTEEEAAPTNRMDTVYLQEVNEIDLDNIHYEGTANLSLKIKLGEQLNAVPNMTALIEGSIVKRYDEEGNVLEEVYSPYPCWHILDILLNQDRGRGIKTKRIDYSAFVEWERFCIEKGIEFNGTFDADSNVWDATQTIFRVGQASMLRIGTKYSVVIDKPSSAKMLFNDSNIIKDTFETSWLPLTERANEIHYTYFPEEDNFKQSTIRAIDPLVVNSGMGNKIAQVTQIGVTNAAQATYDVEKQLRENRLLRKTISFEAPLEAIGLLVGDVAAVQHLSANYGKGIGTGRLKAGTDLSTLNLDSPVTLDMTKSYRALVIQSAVKRYDVNIVSVTGDNVYVTGLPNGTISRCVRLIQDGNDVEIVNIFDASPNDRILVSSGADLTSGPAELWDIDVIEEHEVVVPEGGATDVYSVELETPLLAIPQDHAIWMLGPVESVRREFRLRSISGDDIHRRKLSFIEYNPDVYVAGSTTIVPVPRTPTTVDHVKGLTLSIPPVIGGDQTRVKATLSWEPADLSDYGGADLYQNLDGNGWNFVRSIQSVKNAEIELNLGDDVQFKVVAFNKKLVRALSSTAPTAGAVVAPQDIELDAPENLDAITTYFRIDAAVTVTWSASPAPANAYRVEWASLTQEQFDAFEATPATDTSASALTWTVAGVTPDLKIDVARQDVGYLLFRVRAEFGRSTSPFAYKTFDLSSPALPDRVTGLRVNGGTEDALTDEFTGRDVKFEWRDVATEAALLAPTGADTSGMDYYWKDYEVRLFDLNDVEVRRDTTRDPFYVYSYERNVEDSIGAGTGIRARRAFRIEVRLRGRQGQLSDPATMTVSNPAPAVVTGVLKPGINQLQLELPEASETDVAGVIVWASTTAGFTPGPANQVWAGPGTPIWFGLPQTTYKVRYALYDAFGTDELNLSSELTVATTGLTDDMITPETREGLTLSQELLDKIDLVTSEDVGSVNARIAAETSARLAALSAESTARATAVAAEATARALALANLQDNLEGQIQFVSTTQTTVTDDLQSQISLLVAASGDGYAGVIEERDQRIAADTAQAAQITTIFARFDTTDATILSNKNAAATATEAVTTSLNAQITRINNNEAAITAETTARTSAVSAVTTSLNALTSRVTGAEAAIVSEASTRASADSALSSLITSLTATTNANTAAITAETNARASQDSAIATQINTLTATTNGLTKSFFQTSAPTSGMKSGDFWYDTNDGNKPYWYVAGTGWVDKTDGRIPANAAAITSEASARASADGALSTRIDAVVATANSATAAITSEATARANADTALTNSLNVQISRIDGNTSAIASEVSTRSSQVSSLSTQVNTVSAVANGRNRTFSGTTTPSGPVNGDIWYDGNNSNRPRRYNSTTGVWDYVDDARVAANAATFTSAISALVDQDTSLASSISALTTNYTNVNARVANEETARANAVAAVSTRVSTLETNVGVPGGSTGLFSRVQTTETSITNIQNNYALASTVTSLTTTVGSHTTAINTHTTSINGLYGSWGVNIINNGVATGFGIISEMAAGTVRSTFKIQADRFEISNAAGSTYDAPFYVEGSSVFMDNAFIKNLSATNLAAGAITTDKLAVGSGANILYGSDGSMDPANYLSILSNSGSATLNMGRHLNDSLSLPDRTTFWLGQFSGTSGGYWDLYFSRPFDASNAAPTYDYPVDASKKYEFSSYFVAYSCRVELVISWHNASGTQISTSSSGIITPATANANALNLYTRVSVKGVAPSNAAFARLVLRRYYTTAGSGQTSSYLLGVRPLFAQIPLNATENTPWSPPGVTIITPGRIRVDSLDAISANLGSIMVGTANITNLSVNSLKIAGLAVSTDKVQDNAITAPVQAVFGAPLVRPVNNSSVISVATTVASGQTVDIQFQVDVAYPSVRSNIVFSLYRNGSVVPGASSESSFDGNDRVPMSLSFTDATPDIGTNNYQVVITGTRLITGAVDCTLYNGVLRARLTKK